MHKYIYIYMHAFNKKKNAVMKNVICRRKKNT